jgi:tetratricopeptide (TPR) repeat protein
MMKSPETALRVSNRIVDIDPVHGVYAVERVDGPWLWVTASGLGGRHGPTRPRVSGWVRAGEVVPFHEAAAYYTGLIRNQPRSWAYLMRGIVREGRMESRDALGDYTEAIRLDPRNAAAYVNHGDLRYADGEHDRALADYTEALGLGLKKPAVYARRGRAWFARRHYDQALADFDEAIRLDPEDATALFVRGVLTTVVTSPRG